MTANDPGDANLGVNQQQNYPDLLRVNEAGDQATVSDRVGKRSGGQAIGWTAWPPMPVTRFASIFMWGEAVALGLRKIAIRSVPLGRRGNLASRCRQEFLLSHLLQQPAALITAASCRRFTIPVCPCRLPARLVSERIRDRVLTPMLSITDVVFGTLLC